MKPTKKKVLVEPKKEETVTSSGIHVVDARTSKYAEGKVLAIGSEVEEVKVGDTIFYSPLGYEEIADDQHVVHEGDIHAIIES